MKAEAAFLTLALEELEAAKLLAEGASRLGAYHMEQAAEKAAWAILSAAGVAFEAGHTFGALAWLLPYEHPLRQRVGGLAKHSGAAAMYRYPSPDGALPPAPDTAKLTADIVDVQDFISEVRAYLSKTA